MTEVVVDSDGMVNLADHMKLVAAIGQLRERVRAGEAAAKKVAADRPVAEIDPVVLETARAEGAARAKQEMQPEVDAQLREIAATRLVAAATARGFHDPHDVLSFVTPDPAADPAAQVAKAVRDHPYLVRPTPIRAAARIEQGPQGRVPAPAAADWLRVTAMARRR